jgi:hypothetical protein
MSERKRRREQTPDEVSGEANLPGVEPDELPDVGDLQQRLVEDAETPRGSTEEGGPPQE